MPHGIHVGQAFQPAKTGETFEPSLPLPRENGHPQQLFRPLRRHKLHEDAVLVEGWSETNPPAARTGNPQRQQGRDFSLKLTALGPTPPAPPAPVTPGKRRVRVVQEDPSDNMYLECALEGEADFIVSGDGHLLDLGTFQGIPIVSPAVFLKIVSQE